MHTYSKERISITKSSQNQASGQHQEDKMHKNQQGNNYCVHVEGHVFRYVHIDNSVSKTGSAEEDIKARTGKARHALSRLISA